jgi:hypothetical protein
LIWTEPEWLGSAHAWIGAELERLGLSASGPIEQPHVRPWSTVLRVPTETGALWFKANMPSQAFEVGVVQLLSRRMPDRVPALLAADLERGWMLQADGGITLRQLLGEGGDQGVWTDILPLYAELQIEAAADRDAFLAAGTPDRRLEVLPSQFAELLADREALADLAEAELARLRSLVPQIEAEAAELAAFGLPETIQHDDLHDGQVLVGEGRYVFFDWGDSCVSHPFFTLVVTLAVLAYRLGIDLDSDELDRFRDAYLEAWTSVASRPDLERAAPIAHRLGVLCRGLTWRSVVAALPRPLRDDEADAVPERMRMLLEVYGA